MAWGVKRLVQFLVVIFGFKAVAIVGLGIGFFAILASATGKFSMGSGPGAAAPGVPPPAQPGTQREGGNQSLADFASTFNGGHAAEPGYCARGVLNILEGYGIQGLTRGDAYTQIGNFNTLAADPNSGWTAIAISNPADAPAGAVLIYDRNPNGGSTGGANYGHIEIAGGNGTYISDSVRNNYGGTVPQNFTGYAYIYNPPSAGGGGH